MSGFGIYDPTTIMNQSELNKSMREGWVKLAFFILTFFYYLYGYVVSKVISYFYRMIYTLVND